MRRRVAKDYPSSICRRVPDILLIDAVRVIPLPPYRISPLDALDYPSDESSSERANFGRLSSRT